MRYSVSFFLAMLLFSSCTIKYRKLEDSGREEAIIAQITSFQEKIHQLKAELDVKATGLKGLLFHETFDVVVKPERLLLSLRSFFGPPSLIIANNGSAITVYNFMEKPQYQKILCAHESSVDLNGLWVHPYVFSKLLLGQTDVDKKHIVAVYSYKDKAKIISKDGNDFLITTFFDLAKNVPEKIIFEHEKKAIRYEVSYGAYKENNTILFPHEYVVTFGFGDEQAKFRILLREAFLNGESFNDDHFYLTPF